MAGDVLETLLAGNCEHVESMPVDYFADVQGGQAPAVVSICCADSRVSQEGMWSVDEPGWLFTPSNIGNQAWDRRGGDLVVNGNLLYPVAHTGTETVAVVGHTGCGAVTAAYRAAAGGGDDEPVGIARLVETLVSVVEDGLDDPAIDADADDEAVINQLVEYNVNRQVAFLRESDEIGDDVAVYGFVYDFQGIYGDADGRTYLVNRDGETDPDAIAASIPDEYADYARSLL